jgi:phosphatidylserine decarboxylase
VPQDKDLIIAPADGLVTAIRTNIDYPAELGDAAEDLTGTCVSIFLNVFDVHVNRVPVAGKIKAKAYRPGKFVNATLDKASVDNERSSLLIETENGTAVGVVQIAGLIARRIINQAEIGHSFEAGQRYGLIRFGSRVDVYFPAKAAVHVAVGQRMIGGETIIADLGSKAKPRIVKVM